MRKLISVLSLLMITTACAKKHETTVATTDTSSTAKSSVAVTSSSSTTTSASAPAAPAEDDLIAIGTGAYVVQKSSSADANGESWFMFDEDPLTGWASQPDHFNEPTVVEMADRATIKTLQLDTARDEYDGRLPKELLVEVSDTSATDGFKPIADLTPPAEQKDGQRFPVTAEVPGRWVRITAKSLHGGGIGQIMELRAFGQRLTHDAGPNVTGTYSSADYGNIHLKQEGTAVTGCFENNGAPINGGMEGRLMRFQWMATDVDRGPAIAVFSPQGFFAGWWKTNGAAEHPAMSPFEAKKLSSDPGNNCPQWNHPEAVMASDLRQNGRVRLYGINFDSDSATLRPESKAALDAVAAALKSASDLNVTIEGHTDSTASAEHNQQLSEQRAAAVKQYLVGAGIDAAHLATAGMGSTKPVATNHTPLGRAANRRVELAKN